MSAAPSEAAVAPEPVAAAAPAPATVASPSAPRLPGRLVAFAFAWPIVLVAAALWWQARTFEARLSADMAARPPVAVIDGLALVQTLGVGESPEGRALDGLRKTRALANRLKADGYIVIDRRFLESYPDQVEVRP